MILSAFCSPDCRQIDGIGAVFLGIRMGSWAYHKINIDLIKTVVCFFIGISGLITLIQHIWNLHNGAPSLAGVFHRSRSLTKDGCLRRSSVFLSPVTNRIAATSRMLLLSDSRNIHFTPMSGRSYSTAAACENHSLQQSSRRDKSGARGFFIPPDTPSAPRGSCSIPRRCPRGRCGRSP